MKLESVKNETYMNPKQVDKHVEKHQFKDFSEFIDNLNDVKLPPMTKQDYNNNGHWLSQEPVYSSNINDEHDVVGFVNEKEEILKYRKSTGELVIYICNKDVQVTKSYYRISRADNHRQYRNKVEHHYAREILPEDDYYNSME